MFFNELIFTSKDQNAQPLQISPTTDKTNLQMNMDSLWYTKIKVIVKTTWLFIHTAQSYISDELGFLMHCHLTQKHAKFN